MVGFFTGPQMKTCRLCGAVKSIEEFPKQKGSCDGRRSDCRACNNEGRKLRGYSNRERHPIKLAAQRAVQQAVAHGEMAKLPCEKCGREAVAHHDDYRKQLEVRWLCKEHHSEWHANNVAEGV